MLRKTLVPFATLVIVAAAAVSLLAGRAPTVQPVQAASSDTVVANDSADAYLRAAAAGMDAAALEQARSALALRAKGNGAGARAGLERAAARLPGLRDWLMLLAAELAAEEGDVGGVRASLSATDATLAKQRGWRLVLRAQRVAGDRDGALRTAERAATALDDSTGRGEAWLAAARLRLQQGDTAGALTALRAAIDAAPLWSGSVSAAWVLTSLPGVTPEDRLRIGRVYLRQGNRKRGIEGVDAYLASGRGTIAERDSLRLAVVRALFAGSEYIEAERRARRLAASAADVNIAAEAALLGARALYRRDRRTDALSDLRDLVSRYPRGRAAGEALFILADVEHDAGRLNGARALYRRVLAVWPQGDEAAEAAVRLGGLAFVAGDFAEAARIFDASRAAHPSGQRFAQASYWAGRTYLTEGDTARARLRFEDALLGDAASYHAMRAADHLSEREWHDALARSPETPAEADLLARGGLARIRALRALGLDSLTGTETAHLRRQLADRPAALYTLAEGLLRDGDIERSIGIGREIRRIEPRVNERLLRILYPFPMKQTVLDESRRHGLDPYLVAGLIRQESLFNPHAVSSVGAVGLMQLMPRTAKALAPHEGVKRFRPALLREPDVNVRLGTRFVAELLREYDGRLVDMLSAYNAGSGRLARWRSNPEYRYEDLFVERIPFPETRDYVRTVQQNARIYTLLYRDETEREAGED